jgi:hypothetical protein
VARRARIVGPAPQARHTAPETLVAFPQDARGISLEPMMRQLRRREFGRRLHEQMHMVGFNDKVLDLNIKLLGLLSDKGFEVIGNLVNQHGKTVLRALNKMIVQVANAARCMLKLHAMSIRRC